jgi:hypothetical protein
MIEVAKMDVWSNLTTLSAQGDETAAANLRDMIASARTTMTNLAADSEELPRAELIQCSP